MPKPFHRQTRLIHASRGFQPEHMEAGPVNPPVVRASTMLARDVETYERVGPYGTKGTETTKALEKALLEISSGADACLLYPTGLAAIAGVLLALTKAGDHVLLTDALYYPTRRLMKQLLAGYGVSATFFDPRADVEEIVALMRPETTVLFLESPGSDSMEVLDTPALAAAARERGIVPVIDDTWSAGWLFDPFAAGCMVSIQALTKYQCGHSDVLLGAVLATHEVAERLRAARFALGQCASGDDAWLVLRGLRTMPLRLHQHGLNGLRVAEWLLEQTDVVETVLHPAFETCPGHAIFKRDFHGPAGLFSFVLRPEFDDSAVAAFMESLELFGIGASWGGYESLILRKDMKKLRSHPWPHEGWLIRVSIGLEDPDDLIRDLEAGLARMKHVADA